MRLGEYDYTTEIDCVTLSGFEDCADPPVDIKVAGKKYSKLEFSILTSTIHLDILIHPERTSNSKLHDIAILLLEKEPPYTDFIRPICLPDHQILSLEDVNQNNDKGVLYVTGWGWTIGCK